MALLNIDYRRVGGMRFLKVGRLTVSWSVSSEFKPLGAGRTETEEVRKARRVAAKARASHRSFQRGLRAGMSLARIATVPKAS